MKNEGNEAALKKNTKARSPLIKERLGVIAYQVGQLQRKKTKKGNRFETPYLYMHFV